MNKFYKEDWGISKEVFYECLDTCVSAIETHGFVLNKDLYEDEEDSVSIQFIKDTIILDLYIWIDEESPMILIDYTGIDVPIVNKKSYKEELDYYLCLYREYEKTILESN